MINVDIIIYDKELRAQGIIDTPSSLIWERRFYEAGYFEMHVPVTDTNNKMLQIGYYLMRTDALESGKIVYVHKETDSEGNAEIVAIGRFMSYLLHGHIYRTSRTISGNAETVMRSAVESTVIEGSVGDTIPQLHLGELCHTEKTVSLRLDYPDLHDFLKEAARISGVGFRIIIDPDDNQMYFECFDSRDRSAEQAENAQVIFSPDYDTVLGSASYTEDDSVTVNAVTARYAGEFGEVTVRYNPKSLSGVDLREIVVYGDAVTTTVEGVRVIDVSATQAKLYELARQSTVEKNTSIFASVASSGSFLYKTDYDIGDIVTVEYKPYGISLTQRIYKITETYDAAGINIIPEFCDKNPKGDTV